MKKLILFISLVIVATAASAQSPSFQWGKQADHPFGNHWDEAYGIAADSSGNEFVTGYFTDSAIVIGHDTLRNSVHLNYEEVFLAKYDSHGNPVWARKTGGTLGDWATSTCTDKHGNVFITGQFNSPTIIFGNDTLHNTGGTDFFIAKYDANGNELWARSANGASDDTGLGLGTDAAGNVYVSACFSYDSIHFGSTTLYSTADHTVFIVKYDTNGNVIWAKNPIGGSYSGYETKSLGVDQSGYSYVIGQIGPTTSIMKLSPAGNTLWTRSMPGAFYDANVCADNFGNAYVTGYFYGASATFGSFTFTNSSFASSTADMFLAKYDAAGNVPWAKRTTGNSHEWGSAACTDMHGNIFTTGTFYSQVVHFDSIILSKSDSTNAAIFVAEYDSTGTVLSVDKAGPGKGPNTDGYGICSDPSGNIYIGGTYQSDSIFFGPDLLLNPTGYTVGGYHFYSAKWGKTNTTTGIVDNTVPNNVPIYPNPTNGVFNIVIPASSAKNISVEIYNSTGSLVYTKRSFTNGSESIDMSDHANGIYFIKVLSDDKIITSQKIIKQ